MAIVHMCQWEDEEVREVETILVSVVASTVVSVICCKISAAHTFNVIDGYVKDMIELAKKSIRNAHIDT